MNIISSPQTLNFLPMTDSPNKLATYNDSFIMQLVSSGDVLSGGDSVRSVCGQIVVLA